MFHAEANGKPLRAAGIGNVEKRRYGALGGSLQVLKVRRSALSHLHVENTARHVVSAGETHLAARLLIHRPQLQAQGCSAPKLQILEPIPSLMRKGTRGRAWYSIVVICFPRGRSFTDREASELEDLSAVPSELSSVSDYITDH